jgi:hypothetical protein
VRNAFDAGSINYLGKWEGVGHWKSRFYKKFKITHSTLPKNISMNWFAQFCNKDDKDKA